MEVRNVHSLVAAALHKRLLTIKIINIIGADSEDRGALVALGNAAAAIGGGRGGGGVAGRHVGGRMTKGGVL